MIDFGKLAPKLQRITDNLPSFYFHPVYFEQMCEDALIDDFDPLEN